MNSSSSRVSVRRRRIVRHLDTFYFEAFNVLGK